MRKFYLSLKERHLTFNKLFIIFLIGSIFGNYYEMFLGFIANLFKTGTIVIRTSQGLIYGPFSPIYGIGAVIMTTIFAEKNYKWLKLILLASLIGGLYEFIGALIQENLFGIISWDYSSHPLNFDGKTSIPVMLVWGVATLVYIRYIFPTISKLVNVIPPLIGAYIIDALVIFIVLDALITSCALIRQNLRHHNKPAYTFIDKLKKVFPTVRYKKR